MAENLDLLREKINQLDAQLVGLLSERAELARRIGEVKKSIGMSPYDPARERAVLERVDSLNSGPLNKGALEEVYGCIITACRELQMR